MDDSSTLGPGSRLSDRYLVDSVLGRGGMSVVYRAVDETLGRTVAIKVFSATGADAATVARQRSEIQLVASFSHPTLVTLFDAVIDEADGTEQAFLVLQYVDGATLPSGPLPIERVTTIGADIADALAYVHDRGVIHRDVKPSNILVPHESRPSAPSAYLGDFGIARFVDGLSITTVGSVLGTAGYLSPEQALGETLSPATDVYSLGLVLLQALTGQPPFPGVGMEAVAARLSRDPEIPDTVPAHLADLIAAMTARAPAARPSADEVQTLLRSGAAPEPAATLAMAVIADEPTAAMPAVDAMPTVDAVPAVDAEPAPDATTVLPAAEVAPTERLSAADPTPLVVTRSRRPAILAAVVLVLVLVGGGLAVALSSTQAPASTPTDPASTSAPSTPPSPSTAPVVAPSTPTPTPTASETLAPAGPAATPPGQSKDKNKDKNPGKGNKKP